MQFTNAAGIENICWQLRLADWPRARNRAELNALYNGAPPYTEDEVVQNRINTNVNFLEGCKILHDARRQFATAFSGGDNLLTVSVDRGPVWKRRQWEATITRQLNRQLKASRHYQDVRELTFASVVLHGPGPVNWVDSEKWCPKALGIEDVLIPSNTLTSLENLPFFCLFRQFTGYELWKMTHGPNVDPGWNMDLVKRAVSWVDEQAQQLMSTSWPETWAPEKMEERIKQDGGLYASDAVPTIDVLDFYFWDDDGNQAGWKRRIVLDAWGSPGVGGVGGIVADQKPEQKDTNFLGTRNEFLYNPRKRIYADKIDQIVHFLFADCSCVAPFRYHSVRSLGFLLYAVCHLQNRLRCKFNDAQFESLLQYFRAGNPQDMERVTKIDLIDKGIIPEGVQFVTQQERWHIDEDLVKTGLEMNRQTMADNSSSFTQDFDFGKEVGETATRTMAKVNSTAALVGAMLNRSYNQMQFQYAEIARRFCIKDSRDADVRKFRVECLKAGVPESVLNVDCWDVQPVRVIGSGNKTLQIAMADKLFSMRPILDPEGQKVVDRIFVLANSDDPALADLIVPQAPHVSDSIHDAQLALGTLLQGIPVLPREGQNHVEIVAALLQGMGAVIQRIEGTTHMATLQELIGLQTVAQHIGQHLKMLAQDKTAKSQVKQFGDQLGKLMNMVKAYGQRLKAQAQARAKAAAQPKGNGGGLDPKDAARIQGTVIMAKTKAQLQAEAHAQRTAQKTLEFQQKLAHKEAEHRQDRAADGMETLATLRRGAMRSLGDGGE